MSGYGISAYIVMDADPHSSEYAADHWKARSWLSGFTGSNGTLVVTLDEAALWTDGRYYIQAESQLAGSGIKLMRGGEPDVPDYPAWLAQKLEPASKVGVDGNTVSCAAYTGLKNALAVSDATVDIGRDPISEIWTDGRPELPGGPIFCQSLRYAGKPAADKIAEVRAAIRRRNAEYSLICGLEDVAWLLNVRGSDIQNLPVAYAYAFIAPDSAEIYADPSKFTPEVTETLKEQGVSALDAADLPGRLKSLNAGDRIFCDSQKLSALLRSYIPEGVRVIYDDEPTVSLKAVKNEAEIQAHRECQILDGAAMTRFLMWIEKRAEAGAKITEWDASVELSRFRAQASGSRGDSFKTIAGYGPNGAMMHYVPSEAVNTKIKNEGLMVVDSGGQYAGGTTDITRTIVFGKTTAEERRDFTLTLKSHIALASARFLYGAAGCHVDSIARKVMWDYGLDYKCGTGHGIGCYLGVHEGPQSISMRTAGGARLEENMIVSIEPGVYREGKHGVRIENLARITEDMTNEFGRFMRFEILSFCPISLEGVEPEMLDGAELKWLNDYHRAVYDKISPLLDNDERRWLANATREL